MPIIDSITVQRFFNQGENDVSSDIKFIIDRYSPPIVANTSVYSLPDYVTSIQRVTYRGSTIDPLDQRNFREVFQTGGQVGTPFWFIYNNVGLNQIQLFPTPSESLAAGTQLWDVDIPNCLVIEYSRVSDNDQLIIPVYLRRQLLKRFVAYKVHQMEGPFHDLKIAKYYETQWMSWVAMFKAHLDELHNRPRKLIVGEIASNIAYPASPILPIAKFGISVDEGY